MYRPLIPSDFLQMHARLESGSDMYMPVREDHEYMPGKVVPMLAWGSPLAYVFVSYKGKAYCVREWDKTNTSLFGS
jgi:hypothetical protein